MTLDIQQMYHLRDAHAVSQFLLHHPAVERFLFKVAEQALAFFPPGSSLALEVVDDPESNVDPPKLYAIVETELTSREARSRLYQFRDRWWREAARPYLRELAITVE